MKNTMKVISRSVIMLLLAAGVVTAGGKAQADSFALGNCSENILNGGVIARTNDGKVYFSDTENGGRLSVMNSDYDVTVLSDRSGSYINVIDDDIYYVSDQGTTVMRLDRNTGEEMSVFTVEDGIDEMYVTTDGDAYYLSGGDVYKRALPDLTSENGGEAEETSETDQGTVIFDAVAENAESEEASGDADCTELYSEVYSEAYSEETQAEEDSEIVADQTETDAAEDEADVTETSPEETLSEETLSEETPSDDSVLENNAAGETVPEETVSEEITSEEIASEEIAPEEITSEEIASEEAVSGENFCEAEAIESESAEILHFIPTAYGLVYATGRTLNYDLYADGDEIASSVSTFYDADGYLIMNCGGADYQAKISELFSGDASASVETYSLGTSFEASGDNGTEEDGECEECEANAEAADGGDVEDDWDLGKQTWEMLTGSGEENTDSQEDDAAALEASGATATTAATSILYDSSVSEGQRNMVRRAYQMHLIEWTPVANITGWGGQYTYKKGTTYTGLPYGQPVNVGGYVPWSHSLEEFAAAVANSSSKMYTSYSSYNKRAPYYSTDCSGFVSWAWGLSARTWTSAFYSHANKVAKQSIYSVEIGDALCKAGSHVVMVSDIGYRDGQIVYIDIIEETPPITKLTRYGEGGSKTLAAMSEKYLGKGYVLYRNPNRDTVTYTASKAVLLEDESAGDIKLDTVSLQLDIDESYKATYETDASGTTYWVSSDTSVATVDNNGTVTGVGAGEAVITLHVGPTKAEMSVTVVPAKVKLSSAAAERTGGITIKWEEVPGSSYYVVFRKNSAGTWNAVATVTDALTYTDTAKTLQNHTSYTYTVRAYYNMSDGTVLKGDYDTKGISCTTVTETPELVSLNAKDYQSQVLTWKAVSGAEGYQVYRRTSGTTWKLLTATKDTSYVSTGLSLGTAYRYTVRAYFTENGKKILSNYNAVGLAKYCVPAVPSLKEIAAVNNTTQKVVWEAVEGAANYRVFRKTGDSTTWEVLGNTSDTSYTVTGLKTGTSYTYTVRAYKTVNNYDFLSGYDASGITKVCCCATPELKAVKTTAAGKQTIVWNAVAGAGGYAVFGREAGENSWTVLGRTKSTSYDVSNRKVGTKYTYTVRAYTIVDGKSVYSGYNTAGITAACLTDAPALKSVTAVSTTSQKVTWAAVNGAEGYYVYMKSGENGTWTRAARTTDLSCTVTGLTAGVSYTYTVRGYVTVDGKRVMGNYDASGLTKVCCPATPVLSSLTAASYTSQKLVWKAVNGAEKYRVFVKEGTAKSWKVLGDTANTWFTATKLTSGTKYTYTVRALVTVNGREVLSGYNTTGLSQICVPATPVLSSAELAGYGKICVRWKSVSGAGSYNVYRRTASTGWELVANTKELTFTDSGLTLNTKYIYTVRAVRTVGEKTVLSSYNTTGVSCLMQLAAPVLDSVGSEGEGSVTVSWKAVSGAEMYRVYYKEEGSNSWLQLGTVKADQTSFTSELVESGKTYAFTVKALWASGKSIKGSSYDTVGISCEIQ